ncbi:hypothetical protein INR49_009429 [Caranx melampygus]|nr:hypothetical protein INR49_009429 [Caranx melampygus]
MNTAASIFLPLLVRGHFLPPAIVLIPNGCGKNHGSLPPGGRRRNSHGSAQPLHQLNQVKMFKKRSISVPEEKQHRGQEPWPGLLLPPLLTSSFSSSSGDWTATENHTGHTRTAEAPGDIMIGILYPLHKNEKNDTIQLSLLLKGALNKVLILINAIEKNNKSPLLTDVNVTRDTGSWTTAAM